MANSIVAAPSILAESVIASLKGKLPALRAFSSVFTAAESGAGKTVQVPLIGTSTATEFSTGGYLTQDDATITAERHPEALQGVVPLLAPRRQDVRRSVPLERLRPDRRQRPR